MCFVSRIAPLPSLEIGVEGVIGPLSGYLWSAAGRADCGMTPCFHPDFLRVRWSSTLHNFGNKKAAPESRSGQVANQILQVAGIAPTRAKPVNDTIAIYDRKTVKLFSSQACRCLRATQRGPVANTLEANACLISTRRQCSRQARGTLGADHQRCTSRLPVAISCREGTGNRKTGKNFLQWGKRVRQLKFSFSVYIVESE